MWMCIYCKRKNFSTKKILHRHQMYSKNCVDNPRRQLGKHVCADCGMDYGLKHELDRHRKVNHSGGAAAVKKARSGKAVVKKKTVSDESVVKKAKPGNDGSAKAVDSGTNRLVAQLPSTSREDFL
ncbi:hypothetical protein AAVH_33293, partial [Aphelenchoides avenae]